MHAVRLLVLLPIIILMTCSLAPGSAEDSLRVELDNISDTDTHRHFTPVRERPTPIDLSVTAETFPVAQRIAETLQRFQPGLIVNLRMLDLSVTEAWWHRDFAVHAALQYMQLPASAHSEFIHRHGYPPTILRVAADRLAVVVHRGNPLAQHSITLAELKGVFGALDGNPQQPNSEWGELGLRDDWRRRSISPVVQANLAAPAVQFRRLVLQGRDYRVGLPRLESSAQVIRRVRQDISAISFVTGSQLDDWVKEVKVVQSMAQEPGLTEPETVPVPLQFWLALYINHEPGAPVPASIKSLIRFLYSHEGQLLLEQSGFLKIDVDFAGTELEKVPIDWP